MAAELNLDDQITLATQSVEYAEHELLRLLEQLAADTETVRRRLQSSGRMLGSAPTRLFGTVREIERWNALLYERKTRLSALRSLLREETG